jgi:replicative DNA helicase
MNQKKTENIELERGMPASIDVEKFVLGSLMLQGAEAVERIGQSITADCFALEKHRRIWRAMDELRHGRKAIDRVTVAEELIRVGELESVDGLSYLVSLDDGLPIISHLDDYVATLVEKAALRRIAVAAQSTLNRALMAEERSDDIIASMQTTLAGIETRREFASWMDFDATVQAHGGTFEDFISPCKSTSARGLRTPWKPINDCIAMIQPGDLFLLAARPGMGKSGAAVQTARRAAEDGHGVAYISLEMSTAALERRLISQLSGVDGYRMRTGYLTDEDRARIRQAREKRGQLPIFINAKGCRTSPAIVSAIRELRARMSIGLVIVDHFHLVRGLSAREDERIRYNRIADDFQSSARELDIPFVVLCQLSRKCEEENRAPGLSDLKETGKLEENADCVLFIHRPEMYAKNRGRPELRGVAEFIVAKQRDGDTGKFSMTFIGAQQRFEASAQEAEDGWKQ